MPRIVYQPHRATFEVPRHAEFETALADAIPPQHWSYYPVRQVYLVWEPYVDRAVEIAMTYFPTMDEEGVRRVNRERPNGNRGQEGSQDASGSSRTNGRAKSDYGYLYLTDDAPRPLVDAAYKTLSRLYHPDTSQDPDATRKMQDLNAAYGRLKGKRR